LEENKDTNGIVVAEGMEAGPDMKPNNGVDHLAPIKNAMKTTGVEMPDLVATGDLTVDSKEEIVIV